MYCCTGALSDLNNSGGSANHRCIFIPVRPVLFLVISPKSNLAKQAVNIDPPALWPTHRLELGFNVLKEIKEWTQWTTEVILTVSQAQVSHPLTTPFGELDLLGFQNYLQLIRQA